MAKKMDRLTARQVTAAKAPGRYPDGGGLFLRVKESGHKHWLLRYMLNGQSHDMGLGPVHLVSLAKARELAHACRVMKRDGVDPLTEREAGRRRRALDAAKAVTFKSAAEQYIASHSAGWRNAKHADQWKATLATYVYSIFGDHPVQAIDTDMVLRALEPIWTAKPETASRVRGRVEAILQWAEARELRPEGKNPASWRHLKSLLPAKERVRRVEHHAALPYGDIAAFIATLREQAGIAARAFEFTILTAARTGEVIGARWSEIDLRAKLWTIPAERMKMQRPHRVPLFGRAIAILEEMAKGRDGAQDDCVFPGGRPGHGLSNMALLAVLRRMGRDEVTTHGMRSAFKDWASETTSYPGEVVEMALAHAIRNKVEAAYRRGDLLDRRRALMDQWATYCETQADGRVVPMQRPASAEAVA